MGLLAISLDGRGWLRENFFLMAMAGIVRDDARMHKYCREGNLNKIKVSKRVVHNNYSYYFACISGIY